MAPCTLLNVFKGPLRRPGLAVRPVTSQGVINIDNSEGPGGERDIPFPEPIG